MSTQDDDNERTSKDYFSAMQRLLELRDGPDSDDPYTARIWLAEVASFLESHEEFENLVGLLPNPPPSEAEITEVKRLLDAALETVNSKLGPTVADSLMITMKVAAERAVEKAVANADSGSLRTLLQREAEAAVYQSPPFKYGKYLLVVFAALIFGGTIYTGVTISGVGQTAAQGRAEIAAARDDAVRAAAQGRADIVTARDDAVRQAKQDLRLKILQHDTELAQVVAQAKITLSALRDSRSAEINRAAADAARDLRVRSEKSWSDTEKDGNIALGHRREAIMSGFNSDLVKSTNRFNEVDQQYKRMLGDIPKRIAGLSKKVADLQSMDKSIAILLAEKPTYDKLIADLNAAAPGQNIRLYLRWTSFAFWGALALSAVAFILSCWSLWRTRVRPGRA